MEAPTRPLNTRLSRSTPSLLLSTLNPSNIRHRPRAIPHPSNIRHRPRAIPHPSNIRQLLSTPSLSLNIRPLDSTRLNNTPRLLNTLSLNIPPGKPLKASKSKPW